MTTVIQIPAPEAITDTTTPADVPWFDTEDDASLVVLEFAAGWSADERAWLADEFRRFVLHEADAVRAARLAEHLEHTRVVTHAGTPVAVELGADATRQLLAGAR